MKIFQQFLLILTLALYGQVADGLHEPNLTPLSRLRRANQLKSQTTTKQPASLGPKHPCNYKSPKKPNFNAPNRRISEAKCNEYIWEIQKRDNEDKKSKECAKTNMAPPKPWRNFVIGGKVTEPGEFPHMGAIGWKSKKGTWIFKCGSSLISSKFMLTAAHCSKVSSRDNTVANTVPQIVRLGDKNIIDVPANGLDPINAKIRRIIVHPQYNSPKKYFDIAIIELEKDVLFTKYVQPACLWTRADTSSLGKKATLTGWGLIETANLRRSPELQAAVVDVLNSGVCNNLLKSTFSRLWRGMAETQLCAGKLAGGVDACQGDSGGPLQVKIKLAIKTQGSLHYVIGITSFGDGCARAKTPGVYTRVSTFIDWIESVVWRRKN